MRCDTKSSFLMNNLLSQIVDGTKMFVSGTVRDAMYEQVEKYHDSLEFPTYDEVLGSDRLKLHFGNIASKSRTDLGLTHCFTTYDYPTDEAVPVQLLSAISSKEAFAYLGVLEVAVIVALFKFHGIARKAPETDLWNDVCDDEVAQLLPNCAATPVAPIVIDYLTSPLLTLASVREPPLFTPDASVIERDSKTVVLEQVPVALDFAEPPVTSRLQMVRHAISGVAQKGREIVLAGAALADR